MVANRHSDEEDFGQAFQQYVQQQFYINLIHVSETFAESTMYLDLT